jgi:nonribosomal peptide synthetase DhbF
MWVYGGGVAAGYLNRPELTAARFVTEQGRRYYRSGDLARQLPNGELEYLGRNDQQVKFCGFRIELEEIESVLREHDQIQDAAVAVVTGRAGGQFLTAYVVGDGTPAQLRTHAATSLPTHMVPTRYVRVAGIPLTPSGKTDRAALATAATLAPVPTDRRESSRVR